MQTFVIVLKTRVISYYYRVIILRCFSISNKYYQKYTKDRVWVYILKIASTSILISFNMKIKKLKIGEPCKEDWSNMIPNNEGHFCDLCSKTVIDFTQLSQNEILEKLKTEKGNICVRMTEAQLDTPFLEFEKTKQYSLPYSKTAASIMLAASLIGTQSCTPESQAENPIEQNSNSSIISEKSNEVVKDEITCGQTKRAKIVYITLEETFTPYSKHNNKLTKNKNSKLIPSTIFKGKITSKDTGEPIELAEITYITLQEIFTTYTNQNGEFTLDIPLKLIDDSNVVRLLFNNIKSTKSGMRSFAKEDLILTKNQIKNYYTYKARTRWKRRVMGARPSYIIGLNFPIILNDGKEIEFEEFLRRHEEGLFYKHGFFYLIHSKEAIALYGAKASDGIYIFIKNSKKTYQY